MVEDGATGIVLARAFLGLAWAIDEYSVLPAQAEFAALRPAVHESCTVPNVLANELDRLIGMLTPCEWSALDQPAFRWPHLNAEKLI